MGGTRLADASPTLVVGGAQAVAAGGVLAVVSIAMILYAFAEVTDACPFAVAGGYLLSRDAPSQATVTLRGVVLGVAAEIGSEGLGRSPSRSRRTSGNRIVLRRQWAWASQ